MGARVVVLSMVLFVGLSTSGCGPEGPALVREAAWRTSNEPIDPSGLVWGSTVHLGDGSTIDAGQLIRALVIAGDGVFFIPATSSQDVGTSAFIDQELFFASSADTGTSTGVSVSSTGLRASPDGKHLAVLDADYDSGEAAMRVFDLASGEELSSVDGMDTAGAGDAVDHLLESEVEIEGMTNEALSPGD